MMFETVRVGNKELTFKEGVFASLRYVYRSLMANQPTPARAHWPRKLRNAGERPRLFKGHRP